MLILVCYLELDSSQVSPCWEAGYICLQLSRGPKPPRLLGPPFVQVYPQTSSDWFTLGPLLVLPLTKTHAISLFILLIMSPCRFVS